MGPRHLEPEPEPATIDQLATPALLVERSVFEANVRTMAAARPGRSLLIF